MNEVGAHAHEDGRLGFDSVWIADSSAIVRGAFAPLMLAAARTQTLRPATGNRARIARGLRTAVDLPGGSPL